MRLKYISKLLASSMLISNLNITSFAGTLSEDGRYETFEESSITINNVLEEDTVDVEIKGNTMVNLSDIKSIDTTGVDFINPTKRLEVNKTYTVIFDLLDETTSTNGVVGRLCYSDSTIGTNGFTEGFSGNLTAKKGKNIIAWTVLGETRDVDVVEFWTRNTGERVAVDNIMLLEGDWTNKEIPAYFEGMKSVGELEYNNIEIVARNKNYVLPQNIFDSEHNGNDKGWVLAQSDGRTFVCEGNGTNTTRNAFALGINLYNLKPNTTYKLSYKTNIPNSHINYVYEGTNTLWTPSLEIPIENNVFTTPSDVTEVCIGLYYRIPGTDRIEISDIQVEEGSVATEYVYPNVNTKLLPLTEPLRGLPNGVKDRIIKRNGQWVIERNCIEVLYDGDEDWKSNSFTQNRNDTVARYLRLYSAKPSTYLYSNNFNQFYNINNDVEGIIYDGWGIYISISKSKLSSDSTEAFKEWLSQNPTKIVYELATPIYELLNIDSSIQLSKGTTYISNNSNIPANMKVVVDRVANRALEAIEKAKSEPSIDNISQARYWSNLMKETLLKDDFQNELNTVTNSEDLTIEKKTVSANADVYIKMKNTLSLSLDTNSIVFDEVDSTEDTEIKSAVNLTISSSLPYRVNACLEDEIYNSDKTRTLDRSILNIKSSKDTEYKAFTNIDTPVILLDDQEAGLDTIHGINLRLAANNVSKTDVYKAVIKFEVEQK